MRASDLSTSVLLGVQRQVTPRSLAMLAAISEVNVALAAAAVHPNQ